MNPEIWKALVDTSQILTAAAALAAIAFAYTQVRAFGTLELFKILQAEDVRAARRDVYLYLEGMEKGEAVQIDTEQLAKVFASFDIAGILIQQGFAPRGVFIPAYASVILRCFRAGEELIRDRETMYGSGYWQGLRWLHDQATSEVRLNPGRYRGSVAERVHSDSGG